MNQDDNQNQIKFYEFEKYFSGKSQVEEIDHKCSILEEDHSDNKSINKCSSNDVCYDEESKAYMNDNCNVRESCG